MVWNILETLLVLGKYVLLAFVLRCLLVYSFRLTLHPLAKYPGPFFANLTDWYITTLALRKEVHLTTYQHHAKYGPVVRFGPNKLVFNSSRALHDIYLSDRTNKVRSYLCTQIKADTFSIFNCIDKRLHKIKRRMISKALSGQKMRRFEPIMTDHIDIFLRQILAASKASQPVDLSDRCKRLGLDIIGQFGFGCSLHLQTEKTNNFILRGMGGSSYRMNIYIQAPMAKWMGVEAVLLPVLYSSLMQYYLLLRKLVKDRLAEGKDAKEDLFSYVVDAKDPETGTEIRLGELWSEATFFFPAGGDTTASTITAVFFYLSRYPRCYERLIAEVRGAFSSGKDIRTGSALSSCVYLRAVIDETMRITPPVAGTMWRELPVSDEGSSEPLVIDGHVVPAGTWVGVNTYSIHHNEEYFPEPFVFKPERWLAEDNAPQENERKAMQEAFLPFGVGSRACVGKAMAYMEASLVLAKSLWYFDFQRPNDAKLDAIGGGVSGDRNGRGHLDEYQIKDQFVASHEGPYLVFRPRDEVAVDLD
ncbi:cytochrome P450 [Dendryphion nanum]|uniref:Cytochrome P450 n=1 Tax=Dendryphion nanum TaxID=256645 RepID=A0A9P9D1S3_9PLEO|nr:cytochrome P450 [Dendryphion nanum]